MFEDCSESGSSKILPKGLTSYTYRKDSLKLRFRCKICLKFYSLTEYLAKCMARHKEVMDLEQHIACSLCGQMVRRYDYTGHFLTKHNSPEPKMACSICTQVFGNCENALRRHILREHHLNGRKKAQCEECGQTFTNGQSLKNHISSQHVSTNINVSSVSKKSANLQCKVCPKGFTTKALLQRHALKDHNSVRLQCLHCPKEFPNERSMSDHLSLHTGIKPYRCVYCGFLSKKRNNLFCHVEKAHDKRHERSDIFVIEDQERQMKMITKKELALVIKKAKMAACQ